MECSSVHVHIGKQKNTFTDNPSNHRRTPPGEKAFNCKTCHDQKDKFRVYKSNHTGEKSHQCKTCGKCFIHKEHLRVHERSHTGEKPYQCKSCEKCFSRKFQLVRHERSHTGEKPYQCKICDKCFSLKANLQVHERTHTGEKPHRCKICNKCFSQKGNLRAHKKTHHRTVASNEDEEYKYHYIFTLEKSITPDVSPGHVRIFTCWICQEELGSASLLIKHYDDHMK